VAKLEQRAAQLPDLEAGSHRDRDEGMCATEAVAWLANEPHSDQPACLSVVLGRFLRSLNDCLDPVERQQLKPHLARCVGTAADGKDDERRGLALDWLLRVATPAWLELAELDEAAAAMRQLPSHRADADVRSALAVTARIRGDAIAARRAAEVRLGEALPESLTGASAAGAAAPAYAAAFAAAAADAALRAADGNGVDAVGYGVADPVRYGAELPGYLDRRSSIAMREGAQKALQATQDSLLASALDLVGPLIDPPQHDTD
jgi:hypothetical protein